jgi:hypothetical protein
MPTGAAEPLLRTTFEETMTTATTAVRLPRTIHVDARAPVGRSTWVAAVLAIVAISLIVALEPPYTSGSPLGYTLGLIGGLMMFCLLIYPLRKYCIALHTWGPIKYWFRIHMIFGIAGPILVLFHSTFRFGSPNAAVALGSMLLVALSGVVGRFLYARIHRSMYGSLSNLEEMQAAREKSASKVRLLFCLVPEIETLLQAYTTLTLSPSASPAVRAWRFATLGWRTWRTWRECRSVMRQVLLARANHRSANELHRHYDEAAQIIRTYLSTAQRAAQFRTYDRLFSLWHVVHIPFIYMLVASVTLHVVAVHMY